MTRLLASAVNPQELAVLDEALAKMPASAEESGLAGLLRQLAALVRAGADVQLLSPESELTPNQAAEVLKMSRTHLYKLLDVGQIPFHRVGRDRRIRLADVIAFSEAREATRSELAERFAHAERARTAAIDELADLL